MIFRKFSHFCCELFDKVLQYEKQISVCLLDRENRLLFTGDMCNDSLLLNCGDSSSTVKVYNESMRRLWAREKEFDFICLGHDALDKADKTMITDYIEATDLLLSGQAHGEKGRNALHGGTGYKYKSSS